MERHVDDAGLHAGHDIDLATKLAAGKHLDADRAAGLRGDQLGEFRRHRLGRVQRCIRMAELEGDGALREGATRSPDRRRGDARAETGGRSEELLARYVRGHGRPPGFGVSLSVRDFGPPSQSSALATPRTGT